MALYPSNILRELAIEWFAVKPEFGKHGKAGLVEAAVQTEWTAG
jgi:hypothetical protein